MIRSGGPGRSLRAVWLALAAALACEESVTAPGLCPEFCLGTDVSLTDTVLTSVIAADSSFVGYRFAANAYRLQVAGAGSPVESRGLINFARFFATYTGADSTPNRTPITTDSFRLSLTLARRSATPGLVLEVYRLGVRPDTSTQWDDVAPYFADTALVGSIPIDDTLQTGSIAAVIPASALPAFVPDSFAVSLG
ncbi:MAG TPA: hypothetical protein VD793_05535, partial [Gemmatimonadales bacterium]|nr:hypothetical protein [Gemmatimonadales bacterium]